MGALYQETTACPVPDRCNTKGRHTGQSMTSDDELWQALYRRYGDEVRGWIQSNYQCGYDEAEDLLQQAFLHLLSVAEPAKIDNPRAFLYRTARNLAVDAKRRQVIRQGYQQTRIAENSCQPDDADLSRSDSPEQTVISREKLVMLQSIIDELPARRRRAFLMNRVQQMDFAAIARELGISRDGVKKHVYRALEICQQRLSEQYPE